MAEADLMRRLQKLASSLGARLFRQQVGMAWVGNKVLSGPGVFHLARGDIVIRNARPFHAGVPGMSDLGGWVRVEITPDMIGSTVAVYAQVEVKEGGRPTSEQLAWINAVNGAGGKAGVARDEADLRRILGL
ncbi:VRR-NUC domain-containing protein [Mesorhizobium muleiense]|uniref:VRR-NUC domain-containing protein n=1 Tax=Mesorhizobium muleiense TaxID=1004279 RepID=A0A1G9H006_9HYPH|nr:VRR-NUC domain-containing protein [Mesorhizobium muleiense]SDL06239.1 VRR-NUC domain-containing protein [Mesorhizobium muleiense]